MFYNFRLEEDKNLLAREYDRMPKPHVLEKQIEQLEYQNRELMKEISQRQSEIIDMQTMIEEKNISLEARKREYRELTNNVENLKSDYVQINMEPNQIMKENSKISNEHQ